MKKVSGFSVIVMEKNFIIVGCGNIGSRHLQALVKLPWNMTIEIVEPNMDSRNLAKSRLSEIHYDKTKINFVWYDSVKQVTKNSDLVIVATNSIGRVDIVNHLLDSGHTRFLIEKVVCQSEDEYDLLLSNIDSHGAKGWINTNRRYFEAYRKIKEYFKEPKILHLSILAGNIGLGTNAIHFIDLFLWLTNNSEIKLNGDFLLNELFPNKRGKDLVEFAGTIIGKSDSSLLSINALPFNNLPSIISIISDNVYFIIDETNERVIDVMKKDSTDMGFKFEHASSLTVKIVNDILEHDDCMLPTVQDLYFGHKELFRIFNTHIKKVINKESKVCPIT